LLVRMISHSFHDAKLCDTTTGNPTEDALSAFRWIMREPFSRYRLEPGSFAMACSTLGWERTQIRRIGLPQGCYGWKDTLGGTNEIKNTWDRARVEFLRTGGPRRVDADEARERYMRSVERSGKRGQHLIFPEMMDWDRWTAAIGTTGVNGLMRELDRQESLRLMRKPQRSVHPTMRGPGLWAKL
jgi:hypothetical protein